MCSLFPLCRLTECSSRYNFSREERERERERESFNILYRHEKGTGISLLFSPDIRCRLSFQRRHPLSTALLQYIIHVHICSFSSVLFRPIPQLPHLHPDWKISMNSKPPPRAPPYTNTDRQAESAHANSASREGNDSILSIPSKDLKKINKNGKLNSISLLLPQSGFSACLSISRVWMPVYSLGFAVVLEAKS